MNIGILRFGILPFLFAQAPRETPPGDPRTQTIVFDEVIRSYVIGKPDVPATLRFFTRTLDLLTPSNGEVWCAAYDMVVLEECPSGDGTLDAFWRIKRTRERYELTYKRKGCPFYRSSHTSLHLALTFEEGALASARFWINVNYPQEEDMEVFAEALQRPLFYELSISKEDPYYRMLLIPRTITNDETNKSLVWKNGTPTFFVASPHLVAEIACFARTTQTTLMRLALSR